MCGIAGVLYVDPQRPIDRAVLKRMGERIAHRGPDAEGFWTEPGFGLVHRRLSIIDLTGGDQPIGNEDGSVQVVFNGELYNFQIIRTELEGRGHQFRTRSDTEVLVHLYEEQGDSLVERLRGMFAFALWDRKRRRLLLARDRIGLKPLYVYRDAEKLVFGSELKAILAHPDIDQSIDPAAIEAYLAYGMIPGSRSIFRRVQKLLPGHVLAVQTGTLHQSARRYWRFEIGPYPEQRLNECKEALEAKIDETVQAHRIADVSVGAFLSGGLDSSVVVSRLAALGERPVQTFSIGFHEQSFSELPYAREVARRFGTEHVEEVVTPEAASSLDDLVRFYDEPFADSSAIPTMCVSRLASRSVKVVLSGDGGDEAFGGYTRYAHDLWEAGLRQRTPGWVRRRALGPLARYWPKADWLPRMFRAKTLLTNLSLEPAEAYANTLTLCRLPLRRQLLSNDVLAELNGYCPEQLICEPYTSAPPDDPLGGMIAADVATFLPDDFLVKVDRASMAYGLEVRPPFVDHELFELAARIPSCWKVRDGQTKWILKHTYRDRLPDGSLWRAKHGFDVPIDEWIRGPLREVFESTVLGPHSPMGDLINQSAAQNLYRTHLTRIGRHGNVLWALLVLARWAERYLKG